MLINAFVKFKNLENIEYNNAQNFNAVFVGWAKNNLKKVIQDSTKALEVWFCIIKLIKE